MLSIQDIIRQVQVYNPKVDVVRLERAFSYAQAQYEGMYRLSGDPYHIHALAVTQLLLPLKPDEDTIIASLLHACHKAAHYDLERIRKLFGDETVLLLEGIERLCHVTLNEENTDAEVLRKMIISLAQDLRVILIRLADVLHNMETLGYVPLRQRKELANEAMNIFVPLASRLGVYHIKTRLEDLAFSYIDPDQYVDLKEQLDTYARKQEKIVDQFKVDLEIFLKDQKVVATVEGRLKSIYSIYKKLKRKSQTSLRDIYDVFALRIILPTKYSETGQESTEHLYTLLGLIHNKWKPLLHRFKDYVAVPKPNGYRSLHTTIVGNFDQPIEIQIRSAKMHEESELGVVSHWFYEETKGASALFSVDTLRDSHDVVDRYKAWLEDVDLLKDSNVSRSQVLKPVKFPLFEDRIFVFTPQGAVKDLPFLSTPVDFAYAIHTDVGHRCIGAKVNNSIVPLNYQLKNGDVVEVLTKNKIDPKLHWLSFVQSSQAKNKIRSYLKSLDKDRSLHEGKDLINKALKGMGLPLLDEGFSAFRQYGDKKLSLKERRSLIEEIGNGSVYLASVLKKVFGSEVPLRKNSTAAAGPRSGGGKPQISSTKLNSKAQSAKSKGVENTMDQVYVAGQSNVPHKFSLCCKPKVGDGIVAYVSRGNSLRIHVGGCKILKNVDQQRLLEASWGLRGYKANKYPVKVVIKALDRVGLLRDLADAIASFNVNIAHLSLKNKTEMEIQRELILEVADEAQLEKVLARLREVKNVIKVAVLK